jgi:hypothetical protein
MANYSTGMLANLNGQDNYFDPPAATEAAPAAAENVEQCERLWELSEALTAKVGAGS